MTNVKELKIAKINTKVTSVSTDRKVIDAEVPISFVVVFEQRLKEQIAKAIANMIGDTATENADANFEASEVSVILTKMLSADHTGNEEIQLKRDEMTFITQAIKYRMDHCEKVNDFENEKDVPNEYRRFNKDTYIFLKMTYLELRDKMSIQTYS